MRIVDLIDLRMEQYRAFKHYLRAGARSLGLSVIEPLASGEPVAIHEDDIGILPPYGAALNEFRSGRTLGGGALLMVDLKGPMGVDGALMVARRHAGPFSYLSPMVGQPSFADYFGALVEGRVATYPLAFFPSARQIEGTALLDVFAETEEPGDRSPRLTFAGAVWGPRKSLLDGVRPALGDRLFVTGGLSPADYRALLESSVGALDLAGNQACTYRFSEIFLCGAACVCEERAFFVLGRPPEPGVEIEYVRDVHSLIDVTRRVLEQPDRAMARAGARWFRETQSPGRYVDYLVGVARGRWSPLLADPSERPWESGRAWSR